MKTLAFLLVFCSLSSQAGVIWKYPWQKKSLTICYAKAEAAIRDIGVLRTHIFNWSVEEKETLERILAEEYSPSRTGIHFIGFQDCEKNPNAELVLFKARDGGLLGGQASIGPKRRGYVDGYPRAQGYVLLFELNRTNITHEFAHVAGLQHEHLHPEAFDSDPGCLRRILNSPAKVSEHYIYTPYSNDSVMNYCFTSSPGGDQVGLNSEDLINLRTLYP
jgi:hypothetical protein